METKKSLDEYGRYTLSVDEAIDLVLQGKDVTGSFFIDDADILLYNGNVSQVLGEKQLNIQSGENISFEDFHEQHTKTWFIPWEYELLDMQEHLLGLCESDIERERVKAEYELYQEYNMGSLLMFMKYFMDVVRKNNLVIGVGRGSSVSSYCLYLLGIHKIDSIHYKLDYAEFFK